MGFILDAILSLVTFLFGRIPGKYIAFVLVPFFVLGALMGAHYGINWFSAYAFVLIYSSAIGVAFLILHGAVGENVKKGFGVLSKYTEIEISKKAMAALTRVIFYTAIFIILLVVCHFMIGLPRAAAYFLSSLVGKEPIRSFNLGYYFVTWIDFLKAGGVLLSYAFFFLFVNSIGHIFINEDVKAGEMEESKPVSKKRERLNNAVYVITIIIFIYVIPAVLAFLFEAVFVPDRTTAYNSLALDSEAERLVWADIDNNGVPDPIILGGSSGSTGVFAAALDGTTGEPIWYREPGGEWCGSDIRNDGTRIFTIVRNPDESYNVIALNIADGSVAWRSKLSSDMLGSLCYGDQWTVRDDVIIFKSHWNYGTIALETANGELVRGVTPYAPRNEPYTYLEKSDAGMYYITKDNKPILSLPLDKLDRQLSPYYSLKMHDPEYFETYYYLTLSDEDNTFITANYKYTYGFLDGRGCDALYCFDGNGDFQWEFANGQIRSIEGVLGANGPLVLVYGSDRNSLPLLAGVNARDGELLWTWNRYELIEPPVWERIKKQFKVFFH